MNGYRNSVNIKLGLFFVGLILVIGLLAYSNSIVNRLRNDNREIVKLYSEIIAKTVNEDSDTNLNFVFDEIIKKVQFPIIYSDSENKPIYARNLSQSLTPEQLQKSLTSMDKQNDPIPIVGTLILFVIIFDKLLSTHSNTMENTPAVESNIESS